MAKTLDELIAQFGNYDAGELPEYQSRYQADIDAAKNNLANYGSYQSKYQDQINDVQQQISNYGDYTSKYQPQIDYYVDQLLGGYDVTKDANYQAYKDAYTRGGRRAMADTIAQASALTGGYDNSYAQSVGQQQYQNYMAALADKIPELSQMANETFNSRLNTLGNLDATDYSRWADKRNDLYNQLSADLNLDSADYQKWGDAKEDIYNQLNAYMSLDKTDYDRWRNEYNDYLSMLAERKAEAERQAAAARKAAEERYYDDTTDYSGGGSYLDQVNAYVASSNQTNPNSLYAATSAVRNDYNNGNISVTQRNQALDLLRKARKSGDLR